MFAFEKYSESRATSRTCLSLLEAHPILCKYSYKIANNSSVGLNTSLEEKERLYIREERKRDCNHLFRRIKFPENRIFTSKVLPVLLNLLCPCRNLNGFDKGISFINYYQK